jgi:hypothetical protein
MMNRLSRQLPVELQYVDKLVSVLGLFSTAVSLLTVFFLWQSVVIAQDAQGYFNDLIERRKRIGEEEGLRIQRTLFLGKTIDEVRLRYWISRLNGRLRCETTIKVSDTNEISWLTFLDANATNLYYRVGTLTAKAPAEEAGPLLSNFWIEPGPKPGQETYLLDHDLLHGVAAAIFAIRDPANKTWQRLWIDPSTSVIYRKERYEGESLIITEWRDVKTNHGIKEELLTPDFATSGLPTVGLGQLLKETKELRSNGSR